MGSFINKHFHKKDSVRILVFYPDHRQREYWVIPEDIFVTIKGKKFVLNSENIFFYKNRPTYMFKYDDVAPINVLDFKSGITMSSIDLHNKTESILLEQFVQAGGKNKNLMFIVLAVSILAIIVNVVLYSMLTETLNELKATLDLIIGG